MLQKRVRSQPIALSILFHAESPFSISRLRLIIGNMDDGGGYPEKEQQMKTATPMLQIMRVKNPSIEAPGVFTE
jgi:hypothetical protein